MHRSRLLSRLTLVAVLALLGGACADQEEPSAGSSADTTSEGANEDTPALVAELSGGAEVPGPGDEDASGEATVRPDAAAGEVCFTIALEGVDEAMAAHIHEGGPDVAGPVVVPLEPPAEGSVEACAEAEAELLEQLVAEPEGFYVNVHNAEFPDGAARGQLAAS